MKKPNRNKGITIVSLIITIIIMLILTSVTVNVVINGGLFEEAGSAKNSAEISEDKQKISMAIIYAKEKDRNGILTVENLQKELSESEVYLEVDTIIVKMNGRYYGVGENGNVELLKTSNQKTLTIICKDITGNEITKKEYKIFKSKYSVKPPEVEDYEPIEEKLEGEIGENKEIELTYYKIMDDETELVFTGLDSTGAVTDVESEIVSYMVGDGSNTNGNGLEQNSVKSIIKPPRFYKEKKITKIGIRAFYGCENIVKVDLTNGIEIIEERAFAACSNIKELELGDYVQKIDTAAFKACKNISKIAFGKNINNLQTDVFSECSKISKIIYRNETALISGVLGGIKSPEWMEFETNDDNKMYEVIDNKLYSKDKKTLIRVPTGISGEISLNNEITKIDKYAFYFCYNITKIDVGNKVYEIGERAFAGANKLQEVILGDAVHTIGDSAFKDCTGLTTILIGKDVEEIKDNAFSGCKNLSTVIIDSIHISQKSKGELKGLINYAATIYLNDDIKEKADYFTTEYVEAATDKDGYIKYVKK